jgi:nucleotide-binding universal stress UspA family protein
MGRAEGQDPPKGEIDMVNVKVKKILIPTDFSECSEAAMGYAISLAQDFQAQVFLLHVLGPPISGLDFSLMQSGTLPGLRQKLVEMMQQSVDCMRGLGIEAEGHFVTGVPSFEIIKAAKTHGADLIIMGTHGRTGLAHILMESTAERVIQRAPCPVLALKAEARPSISMRAKGQAEQQAHEAGGIVTSKGVPFCHLCAQPSQDIICETCRIRVQAEAFERKQRVEKEGRVEIGRR